MKPIYFLKNQNQPCVYPVQAKRKTYWYSISYRASWLNFPQNVWASYVWEDGKMVLSDEFISVKIKGRYFEIKNPQKAKLKHVRLYAPILAGGIFAPFAILAASQGSFGPWFSVMMAVLGAGLFYYGYKGVFSIEIVGVSERKSFFVDETNPELEGFLAKVNARGSSV